MKENNAEQLREALLSLDKARAKEQQAREDAQHLLEALQALANAQSSSEIFKCILTTIEKSIPIERAAILVLNAQNKLKLVSSSHEDFQIDNIPCEGTFERSLMGRPALIMDVKQRPEWAQVNALLSNHYTSALMAPLTTQRYKGLFLCVHQNKSHFTKRHLTMLQFFVPLATQALQRLQDIKELENAVGKLNQSVEYKSQFLATISHEIRTPINGVIGLADLLSDTALDDTQQNWVGLIKSSGTALLYVINEVLDFSKLEAGKMEVEEIAFSPDELIDDLISIFSFRTEETNIPLYALIDEHLPQWVMGDPTRIKQILTNFLSNAFKFCAEGNILLTVEKVSAAPKHRQSRPGLQHANESDTPTSAIRFKVQDEGIGLTDQQKRNIFQAFSQADASVSRKYGGTGLGLNICYRIARLLKGSIGVESEIGEGSAFWFDMPLLPAPRDITNNQPDIRSAMPTIGLVANAESLMSIASVLNRLNYKFIPFEQRLPSTPLTHIDLWLIDMDASNAQRKLTQEVLKQLGNTKTVLLNLHHSQKLKFEARNNITIMHKPMRRKPIEDYLKNLLSRNIQQHDATDAPQASNFPIHQVLVAEDNHVNQVVIRGLLKKAGATPIIRDDGQAALQYYQEHASQIDLIVMDCQMPILDGYQATMKIRAFEHQHNLQHCPIVGLSAHALSTHHDKALKAGMDEYLTKPVRLKDINRIFHQFMPK